MYNYIKSILVIGLQRQHILTFQKTENTVAQHFNNLIDARPDIYFQDTPTALYYSTGA